MSDVNYLAVLVAAVASMIVGGIWYGPLFGKLWMQGMGWDPNHKELMDKMKKSAGPAYFQQFIGSLIMAFVLSLFVGVLNALYWGNQLGMVVFLGVFLPWLGFILPVKYGDKLWGGKKMKYLSIDLGYYLVLLLVMGVILALWR